MTLYSDGVLKACNSEGELYRFERVSALLADRPMPSTLPKPRERLGRRTT
jgi:hypothetical protein